MRKLYHNLSSILSAGGAGVIEIDKTPSVSHRLMAWWHGKSIRVRPVADPRPSPRDKAKTGTTHRPSQPKSAKDQSLQKPRKWGAAPRPAKTVNPPASSSGLYASHNLDDDKSKLDFGYAGLLEHLWGGAQSFPGGLSRVLEMLEPITNRLGASHKMLDFSAGCGGMVDYLKDYYGADVHGFEPNKNLSEGSKGAVSPLDQRNPDFGQNSYDFICSLEGLQDMTGREKVLKAASRALRKGGTMVIVDVVSAQGGSLLNSPHCAKSAGFESAVLSPQGYNKMLTECGLSVSSTRDISAHYGYDVVKGWSAAVKRFKGREMEADSKKLLNGEASRWFARVNAMKQGQARMVRMVLSKSANAGNTGRNW